MFGNFRRDMQDIYTEYSLQPFDGFSVVSIGLCMTLHEPHLRLPPKGTPTNILYTLYFQKLDSMAYTFADSMGLSSVKFVQWTPKDVSV